MKDSTKRVRLPAEARLEQLVDAASMLIAQHGYNRFSISALAEHAGLTRAGVLHHVGSKEELLVRVLEARDRDASAVLTPSRSGDEAFDVRGALDAVVLRNAQQREIVRLYAVLSAEALNPRHPAHEYFLTRQRRSIAELTTMLSTEGYGMQKAIAVLSFLDGLQMQWLRDESLDLWAHWSDFADVIVGTRRLTDY